MLRLTAALLVRMGLVLLVLAALARVLPMPDRADVVVDDLAIAVSLVLVLAAAAYLRLTPDAEREGERQKTAGDLTSIHHLHR